MSILTTKKPKNDLYVDELNPRWIFQSRHKFEMSTSDYVKDLFGFEQELKDGLAEIKQAYLDKTCLHDVEFKLCIEFEGYEYQIDKSKGFKNWLVWICWRGRTQVFNDKELEQTTLNNICKMLEAHISSFDFNHLYSFKELKNTVKLASPKNYNKDVTNGYDLSWATMPKYTI